MAGHEPSGGRWGLQVGSSPSHAAELLMYEPPTIIELGSIAGKTLQISDECQPGDPPPCP